jgi:chromosome segregation ATPase
MEDEPLNEPQSDDFESAFAEYAGGEATESPADDATAGEESPEPAETAPESDDHDADEATGDDDLSARLKALEAENQKLKHSEASQRGRLGAYQRQINQLHSQLQQVQNTSGNTDKSEQQKRQDAADAAGVKDWEALKADFPEVANALDARLESEKRQIEADRQRQAQLEQQIAQLQSAVQPIQQQAQDQYFQSQVDALQARHPDWREVVSAPAFAEWLNQQPESLRRLKDSNDAAEAAALMDLYKSQNGQGSADSNSADKRQERLAAAQTVSRRGASPRGGAPDDFEAAFDHYAKKR